MQQFSDSISWMKIIFIIGRAHKKQWGPKFRCRYIFLRLGLEDLRLTYNLVLKEAVIKLDQLSMWCANLLEPDKLKKEKNNQKNTPPQKNQTQPSKKTPRTFQCRDIMYLQTQYQSCWAWSALSHLVYLTRTALMLFLMKKTGFCSHRK